MGSHIFGILGDQKIQQGFENGKIFTLLSLTNVSFHFRMTLLKGLLGEIHTQKSCWDRENYIFTQK